MNSLSSVAIDLSGKTALITGGTRGIGRAIADRFIDAGASVILTGTKKEEIDRLNGESSDSRVAYLQVDFADEISVAAFLEKIKAIGKVDILINNAGVNKIALNTETTLDDFNFLNDVNIKGPYLVSREVSKLMKANNYGRIVNVTSIWSVITRPGRSLYTTTKYAIAGLTKTLAIELAADNILVNAVGPGFTMTELTATTNTPEDIEKITQIIPAKRFAQPVEIANLILFLSSDLNSYLTGQNIIIDGGYTNV
ncbi:SDR family NAD(P)-dependent oxidoreductase [Mucilaginibacter segetis]|uniref:SDR family oxidoreductase n=1 Tax=Mucilaginibacter segetis TaxID=2793071 RepID=A0A934PWZ4_9SPHI|nr:SDR family NAD(P)-dependent oxidoreductase [Mucilaginibacter segetis]MBK0380690.1 SDR family oxidoreductase [Mucilaginibacter segetis]